MDEAALGVGLGIGVMLIWVALCLIVGILSMVCQWKLFVKAGRPGWYIFIPILNTYTIFDIVWGNGWLFLLCLIPVFNIYVLVKVVLDMAICYNKTILFGIGLLFLSPVFYPILAFSKDTEYQGAV